MRSLLAILKNIMSKLSSIDSKKPEMELLWTNGSPNSNFAAQTLRLNLTDYAFIDIYGHESGQNYGYTRVIKNNKGVMVSFWNNGAYTLFDTREVSFSDTGIVFENAYQGGHLDNGSWLHTMSNGVCKPMYIYGIKRGGVLTNLIRRWQYA